MILTLVKSYWREVAIVVLAFVAYTQFDSKNHAEEKSQELITQVQSLTEELTKTKTLITERNQTDTTVTKKPDGTTITETKKTETDTKDSENTTVSKNETSDTTDKKTTEVNSIERYTVGLDRAVLSGSYNVDFGARLGNLPLFGVIRSEDNFHDIAVGLRYSW